MNHQYDPSLLDNVPPSIFSAATAVSNWFNSQSLDPSPRWEFLSICSRNHADRLNKLERELNAANERIRLLIADRDTARRQADQTYKLREEFAELLGTDDVEKGVAVVREMKDRIKRLEEAGDEMYRWITVKRLCSIDCT